jgi:hypothetical protein
MARLESLLYSLEFDLDSIVHGLLLRFLLLGYLFYGFIHSHEEKT